MAGKSLRAGFELLPRTVEPRCDATRRALQVRGNFSFRLVKQMMPN
jgi:hypothetical protein